MNQQRSRRFRASKETSEKLTEVARIRSELALKGAFLPPEKPKEDHFDSNCITPVSILLKTNNIQIQANFELYYYRVLHSWQDYRLAYIIIYMIG